MTKETTRLRQNRAKDRAKAKSGYWHLAWMLVPLVAAIAVVVQMLR
jgi:hypothetical protein